MELRLEGGWDEMEKNIFCGSDRWHKEKIRNLCGTRHTVSKYGHFRSLRDASVHSAV